MNTSTAGSVNWACGPNNMDDDTREEARSSHGDETKEAIEKADQRRRIERRQGSEHVLVVPVAQFLSKNNVSLFQPVYP